MKLLQRSLVSLFVVLLAKTTIPYHHYHVDNVLLVLVATRAFQTAHLPILPFTTILIALRKSATGCDVRHPGILSLAFNWPIGHSALTLASWMT